MHCLLSAGTVALVLVSLSGCAAGDDAAGGTPSSSVTSPGSEGSTSPGETGTQAETGTETGTEAETEDEADQAVEIAVAVRDGKVRPKPRRIDVPQDSTVRLLVTSDVDDEVHVHGFEIEEGLDAGRTTTVEFVADQSGVFVVETHERGLELLQLAVR